MIYQTPRLLGSVVSSVGKQLEMWERQFCGTNPKSCNRTIPLKSRNSSLFILRLESSMGKAELFWLYQQTGNMP